MSLSLTPREMFEAQIIEFDNIYQKRKEKELDEMQIYALEAEKKIQQELKDDDFGFDYLMSVSDAFIDGNIWASNIYKRLGLSDIHAYAVLNRIEYFVEELNKIIQDRYESQYE